MAVCEELQRDPNLKPPELAAIVAPKMGFLAGGWPMKPATAVRRAEALLANGEISRAIRKIMGLADLNVVDTFRKLKDLVNSEDDNIALGAVRTTLSYALPKPTKQVNIDQRTLVARIDARDSAPPIRARTIDALPAPEIVSGKHPMTKVKNAP